MSVDTARSANILETRDVGRRFAGFWAVKNVSLSLRPGERRAILGPNGAGKTTLFNLLTGDIPLSSGAIVMDETDITSMPTRKRIASGLRRTYQHALLFDGLTVRETLFLAVAGTTGGWRALLPLRRDDAQVHRAEELADLSGLKPDLDRKVSDLSHGQRRQLEIGMALAGSPRLLLLDEPAAGLSPRERPKLRDLLLALPTTISVVLVEHDMDIALRVSDSVTVMHNGSVLAEGSPDAIMSNELVHAAYMGDARGH